MTPNKGRSMRKPFVAGNWKMNLDLATGRSLVSELRTRLGAAPKIDVAICPPFVYLFPMAKVTADSPIRVGAQNCWAQPDGAFTGEVSVNMIKETGCAYVILGHSERRHTIGPRDSGGHVHGETDEMVAAKCRAVLAAEMTPIVCVGETLEERDRGQTESVLTRQIAGSVAGIEATSRIVIAYEPVWAIGTGRNASPEQAEESHLHIRTLLGERFGRGVADEIRIQYGGSVKPENAAALMKCPNVDGALVGGASLKAADFAGIIDACVRAKGLGR
jgi:triosephosphate isomerase